ncbi:oxygen-independent coproporphyrinogen-3 oxidase [Rhizobium giardinii]|uniref:Oxygen-independent coproporphyrinogen-3 oxidase n=1 Tax=Rhizobium giardinii TaxID=56731 RepID=A0A7W8UDZ9_9HYPH|nr:oxygen-independent coproporphyrinogen-3 oxidase [Rhizobium giardinii]
MTVSPPDIAHENVPRYTSYPTAPYFHSGVGLSQFDSWLRGIKLGQTVSPGIHIPYCHQLGWFCGCTTKHTPGAMMLWRPS